MRTPTKHNRGTDQVPGTRYDVYRNLHLHNYSAKNMRTGRVEYRGDHFMLGPGVRFVVSKPSQARARREKKRNVHAYVRGELVHWTKLYREASALTKVRVIYNPFKCDGFTDIETGKVVIAAEYAYLTPEGAFAFNPVYEEE